jgi:hypothetical protein
MDSIVLEGPECEGPRRGVSDIDLFQKVQDILSDELVTIRIIETLKIWRLSAAGRAQAYPEVQDYSLALIQHCIETH